MTTPLTTLDHERPRHAKFLDWMNPFTNDGSHEFSNSSVFIQQGNQDALLVLLPLLIVLSTFLFLLLIFLVCVLLLRRQRGILLRDSDGPIDMSQEELIDGEGGFEGVESRWLETVSEETRRSYLRAKEFQIQTPPNSMPTDITLSQFLAIQEKGVSAWSFEPDYESSPSLLVHSRTELTFLPDPSSSSSVQSNLPLPKLNEVYYWEVKLFDLPSTTNVSVGLATKPYPSFRLPGHNRYSIAYHSNGDKSHNYPFTHATFGPSLKEGDVLGVGYRPRSGTVFFTRNGRKLEDAFVGLTKWNLFPTVGADGPCSVHVNLGQSGFVFIEANVKKWGLAPSVGTLAPPPAYGAERGSILLEAGNGRVPTIPPPSVDAPSSSVGTPRRTHRSRRPKPAGNNHNQPVNPSPLRGTSSVPPVPPVPMTPPPPITPITEEEPSHYISPTDRAENNIRLGPRPPSNPPSPSSSSFPSRSIQPPSLSPNAPSDSQTRVRTPELQIPASSPDPDSDLESPQLTPNPPTPGHSDIHMLPISGRNTPNADGNDAGGTTRRSRTERSEASQRVQSRAAVLQTSSTSSTLGVDGREPPAYSPLDAYHYPEGVHVDLPAEIIAAAIEGTAGPTQDTSASRGLRRAGRESTRRSRRT
ncbi:SPRY-domain-containing protein [Hysterangium stoloniferum]|nr:SPRY-domain-containing protein [Hysterangium stoloniferum]